MRHHTSFPAPVQVTGFINAIVDRGLTHGSGRRVSADIVNPCPENPTYDLLVPVLAFGKWAERILALTPGELVTVHGRHSNTDGALVVVVEDLSAINSVLATLHRLDHPCSP